VVDDALLSRRIFALYATLQFNEGALIQRGSGEASLKDGKLPPAAFALLARGVSVHAVFGKLFRNFAPPEIVERFNAFDAANGKELGELRQLALSTPGTPASEAQQRRWHELNQELTGVLAQVLTAAADTAAAEGDEMLADVRRDIAIYLAIGFMV